MNTLKVTRNWDNDGILIIENAKTIKHYTQLKDEMYHRDFQGIFYAFSNEQYEDGLKSIQHLRTDGDKIYRFGNGGFGLKKYINEMFEAYERQFQRIKNECDPQEIYFYEFNNYECCISYDGDLEAIKQIINIWGEDIARNINRIDGYNSIDEILNDDK